MANEDLVRHRLSVASAAGDPQSDPNASIGGFVSSTDIADHPRLSISHATSKTSVRATSLPGGLDLVDAWIVFYDTNLNEVRQVTIYNQLPNTFTWEEELPSLPLVGDLISIFKPGSLFANVDGDRCRRRATMHRLCYASNLTGADMEDVRIWVRDIDAGPLVCTATMAAFDFPEVADEEIDTIADEETAPILNQSAGFGIHPQELLHSRDWARATKTPYAIPGVGSEATILDVASTFNDRALWVRLEFDLNAPIPLATQAAFQVFVDSDDGTVATSFIVAVNIEGVPEEVIAQPDRRLRIAGGARLTAFVRDSVMPFELVPGHTIAISIDSGPGSLNDPSDTVQRTTGEAIRRVYISPTDPGQVGVGVDFRFEVT